MDSLGINSALSQANALTSRVEEEKAERSDRVRAILLQNQKDKNAATDKISSDRNQFLALDGLSGGETAYKLATSGAETLKDISQASGGVDLLGRQLKRSLAGDFARATDNATGNAISGFINNYGVDRSVPAKKYAPGRLKLAEGKKFGEQGAVAPAGPKTPADLRIEAQNRQMDLNEFNNVGGAAEPVPVRTARLNRVAIADNQISREGVQTKPTQAEVNVAPSTPAEVDIADRDTQAKAALNRPTTTPALGEQDSNFVGRPRFSTSTATQGATDVEDIVPKTPALSETDKVIQGAQSKFQKLSAIGKNPLVRGGMKVIGNIQGGEDIYDLFEKRNQFTDKGQAGAGWHEGAHILSSLGTVADIAGIFLPGAEELGAALNMAGGIADSVGDHEKDVANASTVFTNASNNLTSANKPVAIQEGLQTAGLVAGAATHLGTTGTGVSTF